MLKFFTVVVHFKKVRFIAARQKKIPAHVGKEVGCRLPQAKEDFEKVSLPIFQSVYVLCLLVQSPKEYLLSPVAEIADVFLYI